jgi:tetratricopeptide (TPR) repeat protein
MAESQRRHPRRPQRRAQPTRKSRPRDDRHSTTPIHLGDEVVRELRTTARPTKGDILVKVFAEAVAAFAEGNYEEAAKLGEQSKHLALRSPSAREFLGLTYYRMGKWQEAARELNAFKRISGSLEQNPVIADCYRALGKPERAVELCDEVLRAEVPPAIRYEAAIVGASALADMKRIDEAIKRIERLNLRPEVAEEHHLRAWYVLGDLLEKKGRYTHAREYFAAVDAADPDLTDAHERAASLAKGS